MTSNREYHDTSCGIISCISYGEFIQRRCSGISDCCISFLRQSMRTSNSPKSICNNILCNFFCFIECPDSLYLLTINVIDCDRCCSSIDIQCCCIPNMTIATITKIFNQFFNNINDVIFTIYISTRNYQ